MQPKLFVGEGVRKRTCMDSAASCAERMEAMRALSRAISIRDMGMVVAELASSFQRWISLAASSLRSAACRWVRTAGCWS